MRPKNTHRGLFGNARKAPTELSESQVESIIKNFPTVPPTSTSPTNNWTHLFNLNNLIMMSIPIALVLALTLSTSNTDQISSNEIEQLSTVISNVETPALVYSAAVVATVNKNSNLEKPNVVRNKNNVNTYVAKPVKPVPAKKIATTIIQPKETPKIQVPVEVVPEKVVKAIPPKQKTSSKPTLIPPPVLSNQSLEIPELNDRQLKRLRRSLYKNLSADNLIQFKGQFVKIELPGQSIFLNEKELPNSYFAKYAELTMLAGTGPNRAIEFNTKYIKVGDFTDGKFAGHGFGTFTVKAEIPTFSLLDEKEALLDEERKALYKFATKTMKASDIISKGKSLFPPKVKYEKMTMLHQELYDQLLLDHLIDSKIDFVYIQIPRYNIAINGKKLQVPLPTKYMNIIDAYKIKYGPRRAILMSKNTISVGDYMEGEFTGTSVYIVE